MINKTYHELFSNIDDWAEFCAYLQKFTNKEKGDVFEYITKYFLELNPAYRSLLKHVWLLDDVPSSVRSHLNLPSTDQGIDLIAQTKTGEYWAIQCKYRGNVEAPLTWREISTFTGLSFGVCKNISFALLATSGERYPKILKGKARIGFLTSEVWNELGKEFFDEVRAPQRLFRNNSRFIASLLVKNCSRCMHTRGRLRIVAGTRPLLCRASRCSTSRAWPT